MARRPIAADPWPPAAALQSFWVAGNPPLLAVVDKARMVYLILAGKRRQGRDRRKRGGRFEAWRVDRAVPGYAVDGRGGVGGLGRFRGAGDRLLAEILRRQPALCRNQPHR